jgi:capsular exopolysaccharide synthesis family protein
MERIKQALTRAREERLQARGADISSSTPGSPNTSGEILYTRSRSAEAPLSLLREQRVVSAFENGEFTDAYKILSTQVLHKLQENRWNALAVTSPNAGEGKTLTAINLAISLAKEVTYTVLLVDADLRDPGVHRYFGLQPELGLSDYLLHDAPLADMLIHPAGIPRFVILPGGKSLSNSTEMLNSPKMKRLVDELKTRYSSRIVLFDVPPLLSSADTLAFSPYVDAALLVIEEGKTGSQDARRAIALLANTKLIGTVLNKSRATTPENTDTSPGVVDRFLEKLHNSAHIERAAEKIQGWTNRLLRKKH